MLVINLTDKIIQIASVDERCFNSASISNNSPMQIESIGIDKE